MSTNHQKLRVGVVGANPDYGWSPRAHLPALVALPEIDLVAVCTTREESARAAAEKYDVPMWFHDHRTMLMEAELDAVAVSVKVPEHHRPTMDAIAAGKHVYTEWPLGRDLSEAEDMQRFAVEKGVKTAVGLQGRCHPTYLRLKELLEEGYVGEVLSAKVNQIGSGLLTRTSDRTWQRDVTLGANTLTIAFGHVIDALCMCLGEFSQLSAIVSNKVSQWHETDTDRIVDVTSPDHVMVNGILESGVLVDACVSVVPWFGSDYSLEIYGREGTLVLRATDHPQLKHHLSLLGGRRDDSELHQLPIPGRLTWVPDSVPVGPPFNVGQMWSRFADSIRTGNTMEPDFSTAVQRHRMMSVIQLASDTGKRQIL